jgi:hypothetical protein
VVQWAEQPIDLVHCTETRILEMKAFRRQATHVLSYFVFAHQSTRNKTSAFLGDVSEGGRNGIEIGAPLAGRGMNASSTGKIAGVELGEKIRGGAGVST